MHEVDIKQNKVLAPTFSEFGVERKNLVA